jgi:hypothetical protein
MQSNVGTMESNVGMSGVACTSAGLARTRRMACCRDAPGDVDGPGEAAYGALVMTAPVLRRVCRAYSFVGSEEQIRWRAQVSRLTLFQWRRRVLGEQADKLEVDYGTEGNARPNTPVCSRCT